MKALEQPETIEDFKLAYRRKLATVNRVLAHLRHAISWGMGRGLLEKSPFHRYGIRIKTKEENRRERRIDRAEEERLLSAADRMNTPRHLFAGPEMRRRIVAAFDTGCRQGEMLKVQNRHIDWTQHQIAIPAAHAKSGKPRRVPFDPSGRLAQVLKQRRFLAPSAYVFGSEGGTFVGSFRTAWESLLLIANGRPTAPGRGKKRVNRYALDQIDLRWHDIRHECASRWLEQGVDLRTIQLLLGHSKVATTERYLNVTDEEIRRSMQEKVWRVGRAKGA